MSSVFHTKPKSLVNYERSQANMRAWKARMATGMRVPVYLSELAIAIRYAIGGDADLPVHAMVAHQKFLHAFGIKGLIEQGGQ